MAATAPTFGQIRAQVAAIRKKLPEARVIGIRASGRWAGERVKRHGDETYVIEQCDSPLAVRIALSRAHHHEHAGDEERKIITVLITGLGDSELSEDIMVRLAKRKLYAIDAWQTVKSLFQAHAIDPRLTRHHWIADALMELIPERGYPAVAGGFLDAETVWPILLGRVIGLGSDRPDLAAILRWSIDADSVRRFREASPEFREAASAWLAETAGSTASAVLRCIAVNQEPDALAIGLAAGVVYHAAAKGRLERAAGRMEERFLGGTSPEAGAIERWSAIAAELVHLQIMEPRLKKSLIERADEILHQVGADSFAYLCSTSPLGFRQRLEQFGRCLTAILDGQPGTSLGDLIEARNQILDHERAHGEDQIRNRLAMAVRLTRWLTQQPKASTAGGGSGSLAIAARAYLTRGGFVDWARLTLRAGDAAREVSEAYGKLFARVTELQERRSREFAELLGNWGESYSSLQGLIPVEHVIDQVVAPLAEHGPLLLIVLDGMSVAVARELIPDLLGQDWVPLNRDGNASLFSAGLATVPSLTEFSRASLLCGRLCQGASADECAGFEAHHGLNAHCKGGFPPILFHKSALPGDGERVLAGAVLKEIDSSERRVVGVVINAVDDHLLKGDQLDARWSRDAIPVLRTLLQEAKASRRLVVITSDHGHVLDRGTAYTPAEGGDRWRHAGGDLRTGELRFTGPRVLEGGANGIIVPWSESIRYGIKKNGYHGGVSPQEMVTPIAVLSPLDVSLPGWGYVPVDVPDWWEDPVSALVPASPAATGPRETKPAQTGLPLNWDDDDSNSQTPMPATRAPVEPAWIGKLFRSSIFEQQKKLAGRSAPPDEMMRAVFIALEERGHRMTPSALARAVNYPPLRLRGMIAVMQRVLNIDGFAVLTRDDAKDTVDLNLELLKRQFDLR